MSSAPQKNLKLLDLVRPQAVLAELKSAERSGAVRELVTVLAECGTIESSSVDGIVKNIIARERSKGTTGFGKGVAAPHAKVSGLTGVVAAIGRSATGIDFDALDGAPVFGVFLILSPESDPEAHLRAMELVFRHLQQDRFRKFLRQSDTAEKIYDLLREADQKPLLA